MPVNPYTPTHYAVFNQCPKCSNWSAEHGVKIRQEMQLMPGTDLIKAVTIGTCPICGLDSPLDTWASHNISNHIEELMHKETELTDTQKEITAVCNEIRDLLLEKNRKYGDSALNPKRIFSKADAVEQIKVRLDDKISRLMNQQSDDDEDVVMDLMGYLVLLRVALKRRKESC